MAIGQKLEEARNRKGISLREASESTKIRGDYLSAFESSKFDINLPEVYLRGFVRLYARFLDLDQEAVLAELDIEIGNTTSKSPKKSLGSISGHETENSEFNNVQSTPSSQSRSSHIALKKPLIITFILSGLVFLLLLLGWIFFSDKSDKQSTEQNSIQTNIKETNLNPSFDESIIEKDNINNFYILKLAAIGPISLLIIDDQGNSTPQDFKNLSSGWEREIKITKSFRCHCSDLENLRFAIDDGNEKKVDGIGAGNFSWSPTKP